MSSTSSISSASASSSASTSTSASTSASASARDVSHLVKLSLPYIKNRTLHCTSVNFKYFYVIVHFSKICIFYSSIKSYTFGYLT